MGVRAGGQVMMQCAEELPHKAPLYATLVRPITTGDHSLGSRVQSLGSRVLDLGCRVRR